MQVFYRCWIKIDGCVGRPSFFHTGAIKDSPIWVKTRASMAAQLLQDLQTLEAATFKQSMVHFLCSVASCRSKITR